MDEGIKGEEVLLKFLQAGQSSAPLGGRQSPPALQVEPHLSEQRSREYCKSPPIGSLSGRHGLPVHMGEPMPSFQDLRRLKRSVRSGRLQQQYDLVVTA